MKQQRVRTRRYTVTLGHTCDHADLTRREVSAAGLSELLSLLHDHGSAALVCPGCGPTGMTVISVNVILDERDLTERLGIFAEELLGAIA